MSPPVELARLVDISSTLLVAVWLTVVLDTAGEVWRRHRLSRGGQALAEWLVVAFLAIEGVRALLRAEHRVANTPDDKGLVPLALDLLATAVVVTLWAVTRRLRWRR